MRVHRTLLIAWIAFFCASCSLVTRGSRPHSRAGTVAHGEFVEVPWGTVDDWNIIISPMQMGVEEAGSEGDNRLLGLRLSAEVRDPTRWQVTALYRFGYALDNENIHWVEGTAHYLMVRR